VANVLLLYPDVSVHDHRHSLYPSGNIVVYHKNYYLSGQIETTNTSEMKRSISFNRIAIIMALFALSLLLSGCANKEVVTECLKGHTYGFWGGLWHGIIAPIDLVISLWRQDICMFAPNNNGAWYAFGFILGSGGWGFLGGHRASKHYGKK